MNELDYDIDKDYSDQEEPTILTDRETGEPYFINPGGYKIWLDAPFDESEDN